MKKKIIFSCLALLFLVSSVSGFGNNNTVGGIGCLFFAVLFCFLAYRSFSQSHPKEAVNYGIQTDNVSVSDICQPQQLIQTQPQASYVSKIQPAPVSKFDFEEIKLAGVTFNNDNGVSRQSILRKINFKDKPFDECIDVELRQYEYEGSPAYGVYANNLQIGNIPFEKVAFISDNFQRLNAVSAINVYGGGRSKDGSPISYGCKITLRFLKESSKTT